MLMLLETFKLAKNLTKNGKLRVPGGLEVMVN